MVFEIIGKVVLYVLATLTVGLLIDDTWDGSKIGMGAWIAGIVVFLWLIIPTP